MPRYLTRMARTIIFSLMSQHDVWEREYQRPQLVTYGEEARKDVRDFVAYLRRKEGVDIGTCSVLDLGTGTGRNALYFAEHGCTVAGMDISKTAIATARARALEAGHAIDYRVLHMGEHYPYPDGSFDCVLDVMASNSLSEKERAVYMSEMHRVLKPGGWVFYRGLCKDGDDHAKYLLKHSPGKEYNTYVMPVIGLTERVFSEKDFRVLYGEYFHIHTLIKKSNYARFDGRVFKRRYFVAYLRKQ